MKLQITKSDKGTQLGFFYMRRKEWQFGETKCNVWFGHRLGIIVWDGAEWSKYEEWQPQSIIEERITGS
jgi:hypothetical protein